MWPRQLYASTNYNERRCDIWWKCMKLQVLYWKRNRIVFSSSSEWITSMAEVGMCYCSEAGAVVCTNVFILQWISIIIILSIYLYFICLFEGTIIFTHLIFSSFFIILPLINKLLQCELEKVDVSRHISILVIENATWRFPLKTNFPLWAFFWFYLHHQEELSSVIN